MGYNEAESIIASVKVIEAAEKLADQLSERAKNVLKYVGENDDHRKILCESGSILVWDAYQTWNIDSTVAFSIDKTEDGKDVVVLDWNQYYSSLQEENYSHVEILLSTFLGLEDPIQT